MQRLALAGLCLLLFWTSAALGGNHVRVVLDVSKSMSKSYPGNPQPNDPDRLAVLATLLLRDLAKPNPVRGDSFKVVPFDRNWQWTKNPQAPPPESTRTPIVAKPGRRAYFVHALNSLAYDANYTHFYPGLRAAIEDLKSTPGGGYDVRTIVLVTDGVPEEETRVREQTLIREELVPEMQKHNIQLYILAFSEEAYVNQGFLRDMVPRPGDVFVDSDGSQLLENMIKIFSRSFGYTAEQSRALPRVPPLDLHKSLAPERVAVVVFAKRPTPVPDLKLIPPVNGQTNAPDGKQSASETGASYSMKWVLSPDEGHYELKTDVTIGFAAVLRPTRLELVVQPLSPHTTQVEKTMAETPFPLQVLVKSPLRTAGVPAPVKLSFQPFGERIPDPNRGGWRYAWFGDKGAPPGAGIPKPPDGRVYEIYPEFPRNQKNRREVYIGWLEIEARRGAAVVGKKIKGQAHRVEVHPYLSISPTPLSGYASTQVMKAGQDGCTKFSLKLDGGWLPHPDKPVYAVQVLLDPDRALIDAELHRATFTLDGKPLEIKDRVAVLPKEWSRGRALEVSEFFGEHELCIQVGEPTRGSLHDPLDIPLKIILREPPYDDFDVVKSFTLKMLLEEPPPFDWTPAIALLLGLAALLAALWYLRSRPALPDDLGYVLTREGLQPGASSPLENGSWLVWLLGLTVNRPLFVEGREEPLAWVRPVRDELYQVRPAPGVRIEEPAKATSVPLEHGLATLAVQRDYRLHSEQDNYLFRLEYR